MSRKLFSLIRGDRIHVAPQTKVLPAADFSQLQQANELLETVQEDATTYRMAVANECETIKEHAFREGYEEGLRQWGEHLVRFEQELKVRQEETKKMILPIALAAAKKMIGRELTLSPDVILDIITANLKAVAQHKKITIYVSRQDLEIVEQQRPRLRDLFEHLESLSIRPRDDIAPGGCVIETEIGIINAQFEHRWRALEKAFEALSTASS